MSQQKPSQLNSFETFGARECVVWCASKINARRSFEIGRYSIECLSQFAEAHYPSVGLYHCVGGQHPWRPQKVSR